MEEKKTSAPAEAKATPVQVTTTTAMQQNAIAANQKKVSFAQMLQSPGAKKRLEQLLDKQAEAFISSALSVVNNNEMLKKAEPTTVLNAVVMAATLDLSLNPNLQQAAVVPYWNGKEKIFEAQFQIEYKGLLQLCMRSGEFLSIIDEAVYDGELVSKNRFTGEYVFDETKRKPNAKIIGYMAYYKLLNGFEKTLYMTEEEIEQHAKTYAKEYIKYGSGLWRDQREKMARKTVLKLLLNKYAPKSIKMATAMSADQAVIEDEGFKYVDNPKSDTPALTDTATTTGQQNAHDKVMNILNK